MATGINYNISDLEAAQNASQTKYATKQNDSMGKDEFLKLLVTQLKYQDPLEPMDDKEFIAQMAQFSSLEQMQNLNTSFTTTRALNLMGKYIEAISVVDGNLKEVSGYVESVKVSGSNAFAVVDGKDIALDDIVEIYDASEMKQYADISKYTGMVGTSVNSIVGGLDSNTIYTFSGVVESIKALGDVAYAVINGIEATVESLELTEAERVNFTTNKEYLEGKIGEKVTAKISNKNGERTQVIGIVRSVSGDDKKPTVIFDKVNTSIDSIYEIF